MTEDEKAEMKRFTRLADATEEFVAAVKDLPLGVASEMAPGALAKSMQHIEDLATALAEFRSTMEKS